VVKVAAREAEARVVSRVALVRDDVERRVGDGRFYEARESKQLFLLGGPEGNRYQRLGRRTLTVRLENTKVKPKGAGKGRAQERGEFRCENSRGGADD